MNQFFYKRVIKGENGGPDIIVKDSFNINRVLRGVRIDTNTFAILLDDGHEESRFVVPPKVNKEHKIIEGTGVKSRDWIYSEIHLDNEDYDRFIKYADISFYEDPSTVLDNLIQTND